MSGTWVAQTTLMLLLALLPAAAAMSATHLLRCRLDYGGESRIVDFAPSSNPYTVKSEDIGGRFRFKAVIVGDEHDINYIKLYTYYQAERQPVLLHETKYVAPFVQSSSQHGLTGLNYVYSPDLGRELIYGCGLVDSPPMMCCRARCRVKLLGLLMCLGLLCLAVEPACAEHEPSVLVAVVGDIRLDGLPGKVVKRGGDPFAEFAQVLNEADLRIGNLECVVATGGEAENKISAFRAHPRTLSVLKRHFDAVSVANNHSGDFGRPAFGEMLDRLERTGIAYFGGGRDLTHAHAPLLIERHGLRIAFLGYDEFLPRSFEADYDAPGVAWSEDEHVVADIKKARATHHADIVIAFMHWGWEYERSASARQRELARIMIDAGADMVVGGHPHVTQDVEQYKGKPIFYSLGNFVFDGFTASATTTGWLLRLELDRQGVRRWKIYAARMDREGLPRPAPEIRTPCWQWGEEQAMTCKTD